MQHHVITPTVTDPSMRGGRSKQQTAQDLLKEMGGSLEQDNFKDAVFSKSIGKTNEERQAESSNDDDKSGGTSTVLIIIFALIVIALVALIVWMVLKQNEPSKDELEMKSRLQHHPRNNLPPHPRNMQPSPQQQQMMMQQHQMMQQQRAYEQQRSSNVAMDEPTMDEPTVDESDNLPTIDEESPLVDDDDDDDDELDDILSKTNNIMNFSVDSNDNDGMTEDDKALLLKHTAEQFDSGDDSE